jgi:hypothetical protein
MSLHLFSFFNFSGHRNAYREYLADFLSINTRPGRRPLLSGQNYSTAAQQCLRYLDGDMPSAVDITNISPGLTEWVLECLATFLERSSKTAALVHDARCINFNRRVGEFPVAAATAKAAIARYMTRCLNEDEDEVLLIRTPSLPSNSSHRIHWPPVLNTG